MDSASISALSVLGGSLVGALTSLISTSLTQRHLDRRELLGKQIVDRETLYANFISEASRAVVDSLDHNLERIDALIPLYSLVGRIRLSSSEAVVTAAEELIREIVAGYFRPNFTPAQLHEMAANSQSPKLADPLAKFSRVCREELRALAQSGNFLRTMKRHSAQQSSV